MITLILISAFFLEFYLRIYKSKKEIIHYLIVGVLTTVVSIASYYLFRIFIKSYMICTILSWVAAVSFAYITNRKFVFYSREKNIIKEISKFVSSRVLTLLIEMFIMFLFVDLFNIDDRISKFFVQFVIVILNYIFSKILVFKPVKQ